MKTRV